MSLENKRTEYASIVDKVLRANLISKEMFVTEGELAIQGNGVAHSISIPSRDGLEARDYNPETGIAYTTTKTEYVKLMLDLDIAVNAVIDGYLASTAPDNVVAERLEEAGYALALRFNKEILKVMGEKATKVEAVELTSENIYTEIVKCRAKHSRANAPVNNRYLFVSPEVYSLLLSSKEFIKQGDIAQEMVKDGAVGQVAGYYVYETSLIDEKTAFFMGQKRAAAMIEVWGQEPRVEDIQGNYVGACRVAARKVGATEVLKPEILFKYEMKATPATK